MLQVRIPASSGSGPKRLVTLFAACLACASVCLADPSCPSNPDAFANLERFVQQTEEKLAEPSTFCTAKGLSVEEKNALKALHTELAKLPANASPATLSGIVAKARAKLSPAAVTAVIAHGQKAKFEAMRTALQTDRKFADSYLKFLGATENYRISAKKLLCGIQCREENLKKVEAAQEEFFRALGQTSIPAAFQRELKLGIYEVLSKTYEEHSSRALTSARRATIGLGIAKVTKSEILSAGWIAIALVTMGRSLGLATAELTSAAASMERIFTETALKTLSSSAVGVASGATAFTGVELANVARQTAVNGSPDSEYFCDLAKKIKEQGPQIMQRALTGAAAGGVLGGIVGGFRAKSRLAARKGVPSEPVQPEVQSHRAARERMLGKNESILPSTGAALGLHAAVGTAAVVASNKKSKLKSKPTEIITVDLQSLPPPPSRKISKVEPRAAGAAKVSPAAPKKSQTPVTADDDSNSETERPTPKSKTSQKPGSGVIAKTVQESTSTKGNSAAPEGDSSGANASARGIGAAGAVVESHSARESESTVNDGPAGNGPSVGEGESTHGGSSGRGSAPGINLFPSARRLGELEENHRRRYEARARSRRADFYNPDDIQMGSFQRRVISSLYPIWKYPPDALAAKTTGTTPVEITFDRDGKVKNIDLLESSGSQELDAEALRAVRALGPVGSLPRSYPDNEYRLILLFIYDVKGGAYRTRFR